MKLKLTFEKLAQITRGKLICRNPYAVFNSFVTDSRVVRKNSVFWCLKGENFDGHSFLKSAIKAGAGGVIIRRGVAKKLKTKPPCILEVSDTLKALHDLSFYHRKLFLPRTVAVTGSNGKTTTKEMIKCILKTCGKTFANKGNLNNHFGVPFSLLELTSRHKYAVFELSAKRTGDICEIASLVCPDVAVITNIAPAHLEFFGSIENIYRTKTEIIRHLKPDGFLIYNTDDAMLKHLSKRVGIKKLSFGFGKSADIKVSKSDNFTLTHKNKKYEIPLKLDIAGRLNASAACGVALALGVKWDKIVRGLSKFKPLPMRLETFKKGKSTIILDCYNSNPASVENALGELLRFKSKKPKIAVLGDIKELGKFSANYHAEIGKKLLVSGFDKIFLAGTEMANAYRQAKKIFPADKLFYAKTPKMWLGKLKKIHNQGAVILFKASRAMKFEKILEKL